MQLSGFVNGSLSILKFPAPSLVPMATPLTVIVVLAAAWPSIRSFVPLSSAREMLTVACAVEAAASRTSNPTNPTTVNRRKTCGDRSLVSIPPSIEAASVCSLTIKALPYFSVQPRQCVCRYAQPCRSDRLVIEIFHSELRQFWEKVQYQHKVSAPSPSSAITHQPSMRSGPVLLAAG